MKQTQNFTYQEKQKIDDLVTLFSSRELLEKKQRINLYLSEAVIKLLDLLSPKTSRGETVSSLVLKEAKRLKKLPFGMFSAVEISEKDIEEITSLWEEKI